MARHEHVEPKQDSEKRPVYEPWPEEHDKELRFSKALDELDEAVWDAVRGIAEKYGVSVMELWERYAHGAR